MAKTKRPELRFKPGFDRQLAWGKPGSPRRLLCGCCHGELPEVPLMFWRADGSAVSLCDGCIERWMEVR